MMRLRTAIVFGILTLSGAFGVGQDHSAPASTPYQTGRRSQGFLDYMLGKINPNDKNYGLDAERLRTEAVHDTLDDLYLWSNVVTLSLLAAITLIRFLELRSTEKKEVICATLMTQLWNGRVSDLAEIDRRTNQYNALVERDNLEVERRLMSNSQAPNTEESSSSKIKRTVEKLERRSAPPQSSDASKPPVEKNSQSVSTPSAPSDSADARQRTLLLERQIEAMRNTEHNLKERLNQATFQLEQERQRNAALKGA
ncbi:MAG: hypothetical protein JWQ49_3844 [Edaphobacter sp.]|nr:hypothetical protein [Edaphobacter sp.]